MNFGELRVVYVGDPRPVQRAAEVVDRVNRQTARNAEQNDQIVARSARTLADVRTREAKRAADNFVREIDRMRQAERQVGGGFGDGLSALSGGRLALAGGGGLAVVGGITAGFVAAAKAGTEYGNTLDKLNRSFTGLLGSQAASNQHLAELQRFAARTPFEFEEVARASQRFIAMGLSARDTVPYLTAIGNAVAKVGGGSDEIDRVSLAIAQVSARGKVSAQEMNQLANSLVDGWAPLEKELGKTRGELFKMAEAGEISAETFLRAFRNAHEGGDAMARQMTTLSGSVSTLKDNTKLLLAQAFNPLREGLKDIVVEMARASNEGFSLAKAWDAATSAAGNFIELNPSAAMANRQLGLNRLQFPTGGGLVAQAFTGAAANLDAEIQRENAEAAKRYAEQVKELNRALLDAVRVGAPAQKLIQGLQSDLRTFGDDSALGRVTENFRQWRQEFENLGASAPEGWRAMLDGAERQAAAEARILDARVKALKAQKEAEAEAARVRGQATGALQSAMLALKNFGLSEAEAAKNTLMLSAGLLKLNDEADRLNPAGMIEAAGRFIAQRTALEGLERSAGAALADFASEARAAPSAISDINNALKEYVRQMVRAGGVTPDFTDKMAALVNQARQLAPVLDVLRALRDVEAPTPATLPELTPSTATGPTFDDSFLGIPPPNVFADRARRYRELREIAHDLADITSDVFDTIGTGWDNLWHRMLDVARRTLSDIVNEMLRVSFERLLTGNRATSDAGGLVGAVVNGIFGGSGGGRASVGGAGGSAGTFAANLPAFAHGGSFRVGGYGGTDSSLVAFRATPGERVTVTPPGQASMPNINLNVAISPRQIRELQEVEAGGPSARLSRTIRARRDRRRNVLRFA